jgi:hypothetical protein
LKRLDHPFYLKIFVYLEICVKSKKGNSPNRLTCKERKMEIRLFIPETELLSCPGLCEENETENEDISYSLVFGKSVSEMIKVAIVIRKRLKVRQKLLENG